MGLIKKLFRAAVVQPWDYMGDGAPDEWEFRVSPDEGNHHVALYNPETGVWLIFEEVVVLAEVHGLAEMDANTSHWHRFVEELDPDD